MLTLGFNFTKLFAAFAIGIIAILFFSQNFTKADAAVGINRQINFQGKLVNNPSKTNVSDTSYTVIFTLYDNASGATALWTETQSVTTSDGIFRVALGSVTAFPANFNFNWSGLYLGMKVNADSEMTPRVQMAAVPFAFNAEKVAGLTVQDTSGNASTSGTLQVGNGKTISFSDNISFGTGTTGAISLGSSTNTLTLTTSGNTTLALPTSGTLCTTVSCLASDPFWNQLSGALFPNNSTVDFLIGGQATTSAQFSLSGIAKNQAVASLSGNLIVMPNNGWGGFVGIGTATPSAKLDIYTQNPNLLGLSVKGSLGQTANLQTWRDINENTLASINSSGTFTVFPDAATAPSYSNTGGTGDRTGSITVTGTIGMGAAYSTLVDGAFADNNWFTPATAISGTYIKFDFGAGNQKRITEAKFYQGASQTQGDWKWQGSNDNSSWTDIGSSFTLGVPATQTITELGANTDIYRYYRILGISGTTNTGPWVREFEFKLSPSAASNGSIVQNDKIGVGTINPSVTLDVSGEARTRKYAFQDNINTYIDTLGADILTLATNSTDRLVIDASGNVGVGTTSPLTTLDVRGLSGTLSVASISGKTSFAALVANNDGVGDLFTASSSGTNKFSVQRNGLLLAPTYATCTLKTDPTGLFTCGTDLQGSGSGGGAFTELSGAIVPNNSTEDFLIGGQATTSAKFAVTGVAPGTPIATLSASTNGNGVVLSAATSTIQSLRNNGLIIGGDTSGEITLAEKTNLTGNLVPTVSAFYNLGDSSSAFDFVYANNLTTVGTSLVLDAGSDTISTNDTLTFTGSGTDITTSSNVDLSIAPTGTGKIGIFTTSPLATLDVRYNSGTLAIASISGQTSFAALVANNDLVVGDLFTASSSSQSRFTIKGNGQLIANAYQTCTLKTDSTGLFTCGTDLQGSGSGGGAFTELSGAIVPLNSTEDFLIGGQATSAAQFAVLNVAKNQAVASVSGQFIVMPNNGWGGQVGIGTTAPTAAYNLDVRGSGVFGNQQALDTAGTKVVLSNYKTTDTVNNTFATMGTVEANPSAGTAAFYYGGLYSSLSSSGNAQNFTGRLVGFQGEVTHNGTGTLAIARGFAGFISNAAGGTITDSFAGRFGITNSGAGQITNAYGVYVVGGANTGGGTFLNNYGLYLEDQSLAGSTSNYNIYSAGGGSHNYLAGNLGIGTTAVGNGQLVVNQTNFAGSSGDIFSASTSGATKFVITNAGSIGLYGTNPSITNTGANTLTLNSGSTGDIQFFGTSYKITSGGALTVASCTGCGGSSSSGPFAELTNLGLIVPNNSTEDFLIGGQATASAQFSLAGIAKNQLVASVSGNLIVMANNGWGGFAGIGVTTPQANLHVRTSAISNATYEANSVAIFERADARMELVSDDAGPVGGAIILNNVSGTNNNKWYMITGTGSNNNEFFLGYTPNATNNIFTGYDTNTKLAITTNGNIGMGTITPTAKLDVVGAASIGGQLTFRDTFGTIQTTRNQELTIGGDTTGNITISPLNGGAGSLLTVNALTTTLNGTTTLYGTSLTTINGGATAINFTEFDVDAGNGGVTINDAGNLGFINIESTILDIDSLTFVGAGLLSSGGANSLSLDTGGAAAINIGSTTNATSVSLCNSANCDTLTLANNADADTITIGDGLDTFSITSTAFDVSSTGALSGITTLAASGDITWSATTPQITINAAETFTISNGTAADNFVYNTSTNALTIGDGTNGLTFDIDTGMLYQGTGRLTKRITLTPEYAGGAIMADGAANTGTMTSDNTNAAGTEFRNFYKWENAQGTAQDYDIWISVPIPNDFSAMAATPTLSIDTYSSDLTNGTVLVTVYDSQATPVADCTDVAFTPTGAINTWETKTATTCLDTGTYTAGGVMTIKIHLTAAATTGVTQVSTVTFDYRAKF